MPEDRPRSSSSDPFEDDLGDFLEDFSSPAPEAAPPRSGRARRGDQDLTLDNLGEPDRVAYERRHMPGPESGAPRPESSRPAPESPAPSHPAAPRAAAPQREAPAPRPQQREAAPERPSPEVRAAPEPAAPPRAAARKAFEDEQDDSGEPEEAETREGRPGKGAPLRGSEKIALAAIAGILLVLAVVFWRVLLPDAPAEQGDRPAEKLKLPVRGQHVELAEANAYWRDRADGDRAKPEVRFLPVVELTMAGSAPEAYVQVIVRDDEDRIRGDVHAFSLAGGKTAGSGSKDFVAVGTEGYENPMLFLEYRGELERDWTVEILESTDPKASGDQWKRIAYFEMPKRYARND